MRKYGVLGKYNRYLKFQLLCSRVRFEIPLYGLKIETIYSQHTCPEVLPKKIVRVYWRKPVPWFQPLTFLNHLITPNYRVHEHNVATNLCQPPMALPLL